MFNLKQKIFLIFFGLFSCQVTIASSSILNVGVMHDAIPFSHLDDKSDIGFGIALFKEAALINKWQYNLHRIDGTLESALPSLLNKKNDILVGPLSHVVSQSLALTNTFFIDSLTVAMTKDSYGFWRLFKTRFSHQVITISLQTLIAFCVLVHLFMLIEWKRGHNEYKTYGKALYNTCFSFYMTMTSISMTILPKSLFGKFVMVAWIIISLLFMHGVIGVLTSSITLSDIHTAPFTKKELKGKKIGVYGRFLPPQIINLLSKTYGFEPLSVERLPEGMALLREKRIEGFIANTSLLDAFLTQEDLYSDIVTSQLHLGTLSYGFMMRKDDPRLEAFNKVILELQDNKLAQGICRNYMSYPEAHRCAL